MGRRLPKCFVAKHEVSILNGVLHHGAPNEVVFEDLTTNHNKIFFTFENFSLSSTLIITVNTDTGELPPFELEPRISQLQRSFISFQVEDVRQVNIRAIGLEGEQSAYNMFVTKTFCICCVKKNCFIDTHSSAFTNYGLRAGISKTIFQDVTTNHNKTMVRIRGAGSQPVVVTFITDQGMVDKTIQPTKNLIIQLEDLRQILALVQDSNSEISLSVEKTFCICCP